MQWEVGARVDAMTGVSLKGSAAAGATWRVAGTATGAQWTVGVRAAQALRAPTLYDLYFSAPQRLQVRALAPERVRLDASLSVAGQRGRGTWHQPRLAIEGALVTREVANAIIWFPGNFGWSPANVGREQLGGMEGQATVVWPTVQLRVWGTAYRAEVHTGDLRIPTPYVPRGDGVVQLEWRSSRWTTSATGRAMGARPFTAGPRDPAFELPPVARLDLGLAYRLSRRARWSGTLLSLALDNATGVRWQSVQGFPMPGRTWQIALHVMPHSPS
jgi:outer membrane cobalamin receptor